MAELDPTRRQLMGAAAFSLAALALPASIPAGHPPQGGSVSTPAMAMRAEQMRTAASTFAAAAERYGGGSIRASLAAYLAHDVTTWLHASSAGRAHRALLSAAAQLELLLGGMCADDGDDAVAQHHQRTAVDLAGEADDRAMAAVALRTMATHAHDLGHHGLPVLHLTEEAARLASGALPATQAYTQAHLAVLQAHHDHHAALTTLARAERLYSQADSVPGPFTAYPSGALHYQRAQTLLALGDRPGAVAAFTASLRMRSTTDHRATTLTHARLAEVHLDIGNLDAAQSHWEQMLDTYPALQSVRATRRLHVMRQRLLPHRKYRPAARALTRTAALVQ
jgi:tetratricopeptide (TPR) repeat protein